MKRTSFPNPQRLPTGSLCSPDDPDRWEDNIEKVLRHEQPPEILIRTDGPYLDEAAQGFRRPSAAYEAIPAPKPPMAAEEAKPGRMKKARIIDKELPLMEKISEDTVGSQDHSSWQLHSDSDTESIHEPENEERPRKVSSHATERPPRQKSYFQSSHKNPSKMSHDNLAFDLDEDPDKSAVNSHRIDPPYVTPVYKRPRAASCTAGLEVTKVSYTAFKDRLERDRTPKSLFVQMDVFKEDEWQEQARWIKFEEALLEGADRWGNPHISSLSFHSLINLRLVLEKCVFILDDGAIDFTTVVYHLVDEFTFTYDLSEETKLELLRAFFMPHKHVDAGTHHIDLHEIRRRLSRSATRTSIRLPESIKRESLANGNDTWKSDHTSINIHDDNDAKRTPSSSDLFKMAQKRDSIMHRLEDGTEGSMALVGSLQSISEPLVGFVRLSSAVIMPHLLEVPVPTKFIFVLLLPEFSPNMDYVEVGRSFCTLMSNKKFQAVCYGMEERQDMLTSINHFLDETVVLPPGDWDKKNLLSMSEIQELRRKKRIRMEMMDKLRKDKGKKKEKKQEAKKEEKEKDKKMYDPLERTNVPFGGCIREIAHRFPKYWSDITDGLNVMCLATVIYIFFAVVAAAITFGGLWGQKTGGLIGIPETLLLHSVIGCAFALFSCQPLVIIGVTGPLMVFDEALYKFSVSSEVEFLTWRTWISFWVVIIALTVAAFQGSFVVRYFTSFTKDIYAMFIASIYIAEAIENTIHSFQHHPALPIEGYCNASHESLMMESVNDSHNYTFLNSTHEASLHEPAEGHRHGPEPNTAFKTLILQYLTYAIAYRLKLFRSKHALGKTVRRYLGDFAVPISVLVMIGFDQGFPYAYTDKLLVPDGLDLTSPDKRSWFINPLGTNEYIPIWMPFASILPAILVYLLLFMETSISELILMDKLKKGTGIHWDIVLLSLLNVLSGLFGAPFMCAATVRAMSHLAALTVYSTKHAPGESPKIVEIKDQRVTAFFIYLFIGLAIALSSVLKYIPTSCLFGIFLYMGTYSLHGIQLYDRLILALVPVKYHPNKEYVRRVRTWRMHLYTFLQTIGFAVLWIVKSTSVALAFPFFVVGMIPYRFCFRFIFSKKELDALDGPNADKAFIEDIDDIPDAH